MENGERCSQGKIRIVAQHCVSVLHTIRMLCVVGDHRILFCEGAEVERLVWSEHRINADVIIANMSRGITRIV